MDFLDPKKRRNHKIRLFIGYALMAVLILSLATLLVFLAFGYTFDPRTGEISQNGLVFVDAHPEAAEVLINGESKGNTDQRLVLPASNYSLELRREGYHSWKRDFMLEGGTIERFVYPFLFPVKLTSSEVELYSNKPAFASQSPDRRWLFVQRPGGLADFDLYDLNGSPIVPAEVNLPNNLLRASGDTHKLELIEWSTDNRHLLVKHTFSDGSEFAVIDREVPADSVNLSVLFPNANFTNVALRDKRFDRYYFHNQSSGVLQTAELQNRSVEVLLEGVKQFRSHGADVILFITTHKSDKNLVVAKVMEGDDTFELKNLPADDKYLLDVASFEDRWYMAVGAVSEQKIYVMRNPVALLRQDPPGKLIPAATLRIKNGQYISFSSNARFIAVQSGSRFAVYDAETDRVHSYDTEIKLAKGQKANWMDGHRLTLNSGSRFYVFDFDGTNSHRLAATYADHMPFFRQDYEAVFSFADAPNIDNRSALLNTSLLAGTSE